MPQGNLKDYKDIVSNPGKFEGEQPYVPYFWEIFLECGADEDDGFCMIFNVTDEDRAFFLGYFGNKEKVVLYEDVDGFIFEVPSLNKESKIY